MADLYTVDLYSMTPQGPNGKALQGGCHNSCGRPSPRLFRQISWPGQIRRRATLRWATMKQTIVIISLVCAMLSGTVQADPALPIRSGEYIFQHRDAEFPSSHGFPVRVTIRGNKITVINPKPYGPIPGGVIEQATLMWHTKTNQWILGHGDADREAPEVGGCSNGPNVIDFKTRIIWTCEGGP